MTCAQGLLRLLWGGGPKLECYGTVCCAVLFSVKESVGYFMMDRFFFVCDIRVLLNSIYLNTMRHVILILGPVSDRNCTFTLKNVMGEEKN